MKTVMLGDRIGDRAEQKEMIVLDGTTQCDQELRQANRERHLDAAFRAGKSL